MKKKVTKKVHRAAKSKAPRHTGERAKPIEVLAIIDRSGSMQPMRQEVIGSFNTFLKDQKAVKGKANITLIQFDDKYEPNYSSINIQTAPDLSFESYSPRGSTALLDAMGKALSELKARHKGKAVVCVITDGMENASREWSGEKLRDLIKECEKMGWGFVYLAANQDAFASATTLGININLAQNAVASYGATGQSTQTAYAAMSSSVRSYRNTGGTVAFMDSRLRKKLEDDVKTS